MRGIITVITARTTITIIERRIPREAFCFDVHDILLLGA